MTDFLLAAAGFVLLMVALGLVPVLRGPRGVDRLMAVQLVGTGGIAILLLLDAAIGLPGLIDICVVLALLAAFVAAAFVRAGEPRAGRGR